PKEFLEYLKKQNIKTIYTTHDFYGLCPKMLNNDPKEALKTSECSYDCLLCNVGPSYKKIVIMQSHLYANLKDSKFVKVYVHKIKLLYLRKRKIVLSFLQIRSPSDINSENIIWKCSN